MKGKKYVALLTMLAMVICTMFCTNTVKAETGTSWDESDIVEISTCIVDGVERSLITFNNNEIYLKVGDNEPIYVTWDTTPYKFDKYGTIWNIDTDNIIYWISYDFADISESSPIRRLIDEGYYSPVEDIKSFIFDSDNKFVIGFETLSGNSYYTHTPDEIKTIVASDFSYYPALRPMSSSQNSNPTPTPTPATPTPVPTPTPVSTPTPTNTDKPVVTQKPTASPQPTVAPKVSLKKQSGYTCLSVGNKVVSKYKLKKGVLTWKGTKKSMKIKQVKQVGYIEKSQNLIYMTKKGGAYTISQKGKKKTVLKKGAKKLIFKNRYVIKIKKKSGYTNVVNK